MPAQAPPSDGNTTTPIRKSVGWSDDPPVTIPPNPASSPPPDEWSPSAASSMREREIDVDWAMMDPTITPQQRGRAILDAISDPLRPPEHWQGDQLTIMGVRFYWHPELGYITVPDDEEGCQRDVD